MEKDSLSQCRERLLSVLDIISDDPQIQFVSLRYHIKTNMWDEACEVIRDRIESHVDEELRHKLKIRPWL